MRKPDLPEEVLKFFQKTGSIGGKERAKRYTKEQLSEMGKKGGRPKKLKPNLTGDGSKGDSK